MWPFRKYMSVWKECKMCNGTGEDTYKLYDIKRGTLVPGSYIRVCVACKGYGGKYFKVIDND